MTEDDYARSDAERVMLFWNRLAGWYRVGGWGWVWMGAGWGVEAGDMGCSVETLQRRIGYGGRKGRAAVRRVRAISGTLSTDRDACREFYRAVDARKRSQGRQAP